MRLNTGRCPVKRVGFWSIGGETDSAVALHWREKGGPKVESSNKQGFGSQLVAQCIKALSATHQSRFSAEGFECSIAFVLRA